jgi:hypothetical protein
MEQRKKAEKMLSPFIAISEKYVLVEKYATTRSHFGVPRRAFGEVPNIFISSQLSSQVVSVEAWHSSFLPSRPWSSLGYFYPQKRQPRGGVLGRNYQFSVTSEMFAYPFDEQS